MRLTGSTTMRAMSVLLSCGGLVGWFGRGSDHRYQPMRGDTDDRRARESEAQFARGHIHTEARNRWQPVIERRHVIPEPRRRTTNATVPRANGPAGVVVPLHDRTVEGRFGSFASHLVKAPALAMTLVAPFGNKASGIEVSAAFALIVDDPAIRKERPVVLIEI